MEGPVHRYMESSPGCWSMYGEVLAREYADAAYNANHRLTVDAYAVQHPGQPSRQSIQSVGLHLTSLFLVLERGVQLDVATEHLQRFARHKATFHRLDPPDDLGSKTIRDVWEAEGLEAHLKAVRDWAASAWAAWATHHGQIREWVRRFG